jgi:hypothetical protein
VWGDKEEIWLPDMSYTCSNRGMKVFKIRRGGMFLSNQLGLSLVHVCPPLYGPLELSESSQAPSPPPPTPPPYLAVTRITPGVCRLSSLFGSLFSSFFLDPRDPCRFLHPAFLTGQSVRLSFFARTVFLESSHYPLHTTSPHLHISLSA